MVNFDRPYRVNLSVIGRYEVVLGSSASESYAGKRSRPTVSPPLIFVRYLSIPGYSS